MLSLPYAYADREIAWAGEVIAAHPDYNVIVSTHEHLMPKTDEVGALRVVNSRWTSHAAELWETVIAPSRNVVAVLCGHFHGLGQIVTEDAGGIPGHTVVELLADYQEFRTHTGERATGFFRMLQFDIDQGAIAVDTRSMVLQESASHEYDYRQFVPDNGSPYVMSNVRPWRIIEAGLQDRYTDEDDEFTALPDAAAPEVGADHRPHHRQLSSSAEGRAYRNLTPRDVQCDEPPQIDAQAVGRAHQRHEHRVTCVAAHRPARRDVVDHRHREHAVVVARRALPGRHRHVLAEHLGEWSGQHIPIQMRRHRRLRPMVTVLRIVPS